MPVDTAKELLNLELPQNDAYALTVRDYLKALLKAVWVEGEGFSGKRPFGNSSWQYELYLPMVMNGFVEGKFDSDGGLEEVNTQVANSLIEEAIDSL